MRILFAGTPEIAVPSLKKLASAHDVAAVLTNPDRVAGRGRKLINSPVKDAVLELDLPLLQPEKLDDSVIEEIKKLNVDLMVVVAYGTIFRRSFLDLFPEGAVNLHPSRLPEYRGSSPLNAAIRDGVKVSAVSVQKMAMKMDAGDILMQKDLVISDDDTVETLGKKAGEIGADMLSEVLSDWTVFKEKAVPQNDDEATFCHMIHKNEGLIDWNKSAGELDCFIRSVTPWPGAFSFEGEQKIIFYECSAYSGELNVTGNAVPGQVVALDKKRGILIQTGNGLLAVASLKPASKKRMDYKSFINGNRDFIGAVLGDN